MLLKSGQRLQSTACDTQVIVVRAPVTELDLRCGGAAMAPIGGEVTRSELDPGHAGGTLMGKRYGLDESGLEILCTKPGAGSLSIGADALPEKGAKALPSSD